MKGLRRRRFLVTATSVVGGAGIAGGSLPFLASMLPSERARAVGAPVEADLTVVAPGTLATVEWRGKPAWILSRTPSMIETLGKLSDQLRDPDSRRLQQPECCRNAHRSIKPEYFVAIGLCTHLGCVPTFLPEAGSAAVGPDWLGGFFCPCHGSRFDFAGRVFKNVPAPSTLVVPPHRYLAASRLLVGVDTQEV